jgi:hypothetical protein
MIHADHFRSFGLTFTNYPSVADCPKRSPALCSSQEAVMPRPSEKRALIQIDQVFLHIPAYQELRELDLDESDPRAMALIERANDTFQAAFDRISHTHGFNTIYLQSPVADSSDELPDITALAIHELSAVGVAGVA